MNQRCPYCHRQLEHYIAKYNTNIETIAVKIPYLVSYEFYECDHCIKYFQSGFDKNDEKLENIHLVELNKHDLELIIKENTKFFDLRGEKIDLELLKHETSDIS